MNQAAEVAAKGVHPEWWLQGQMNPRSAKRHQQTKVHLKASRSPRRQPTRTSDDDSLDTRISVLKNKYYVEESESTNQRNLRIQVEPCEMKSSRHQNASQYLRDSGDDAYAQSSSMYNSTPSLPATHTSVASYGYTRNVEKYRCAPPGAQKAGQQNIAMSYSGPPSQSEIHRNAGRWRNNRNYQAPSCEL